MDRHIRRRKVKLDTDNTKTDIVTRVAEIFSGFNTIEVEAGTTGACGGDAGHGCRTYFRIEGKNGTAMSANTLTDSWDEPSGVEVTLGGDAELDTIIEALRVIADNLEEQQLMYASMKRAV